MSRSITIYCMLMVLGIFFVLHAQSAAVNNLLKNKDLKKIEQKIDQKAAQTATAAKASAAQLLQTDAGIPLVGDLTDADEQALGRETAGRLLAAYPVVKNDSLQKYVNSVGILVAKQSKRPSLAWTFAVIESDDINAFAMPGGYVVLTRGLYRILRNEAELAGVLGHEIAHVNLRHHVRLMQKQLIIAKGSDFLKGKTRADALKELVGSGAVITARSLDKEAEYECDRTGIEYTARTGYDPFSYLEVLGRMGADRSPDRLALLFKTHPHPRDRIDVLAKSIDTKWSGVMGIIPKRWMELE